ncbi:prolactin-releasing peptide isoform X1 [Oxyura jamaicensis]|uniref:prolactin-releasing peptide isoform X1 n=1 Tax=Oxyura jamaicensis TaxID=8884 RepID=UPI0015A53E22|nr:prolactin-releasing peptide isoform X1 [Oxyura jamaicensis]
MRPTMPPANPTCPRPRDALLTSVPLFFPTPPGTGMSTVLHALCIPLLPRLGWISPRPPEEGTRSLHHHLEQTPWFYLCPTAIPLLLQPPRGSPSPCPWPEPSWGQNPLGMKLGATCLVCLLLACLALPAAATRIRSMEIRSKESSSKGLPRDTPPAPHPQPLAVNPGGTEGGGRRADPDIDPSWYTGRGIRPVGRFGRRRALGEGTQLGGGGLRPVCAPLHPQPPRGERSA